MICTSLTKMFSGACDVMGGSIALNPRSPHYHAFSSKLETNRVDSYFPSDVLITAANSSDFPSRVRKANKSASIIATKLREDLQALEVFYPEGSASQKYYDAHQRANAGYGFLLSIKFVHLSSATAFYDALAVAKGPFHACLCVCLTRACERAGVGREIWCCREFGADQYWD
jgi:cystathionine gamma-synthase